jgi:hypothetical protein
MPSYFLVSLSNRANLELCMKHGLAGFTNSVNGLWAFLDIEEGDYVSFLYGARAHNLYRVVAKQALSDAADLPPWPPVTFKRSGRTYYFPFRLHLEPLREFHESLVRAEFAYVAENLLLRGGYAKTQFQADQTTLQAASQMGTLGPGPIERLALDTPGFTPRLVFNRSTVAPPMMYFLQETIVQVALKKYLSNSGNLSRLLGDAGITDVRPDDLEVLGERALPEGHVDILLKEKVPVGTSNQIVIEVKRGKAGPEHVTQLSSYVQQVGRECRAGVLVAGGYTRAAIQAADASGVKSLIYSLGGLAPSGSYTLSELVQALTLEAVS